MFSSPYYAVNVLTNIASPHQEAAPSLRQIRFRHFIASGGYAEFSDFLVFYRWSCIVIAAMMYVVVVILLRKRFIKTSRAFVPSMSKMQSNKIMRSNVTMVTDQLSHILRAAS
ncbi:hypothetical protein OSTOST_03830 [Ostertagia ostertagi]